jgi:2-polyprenyl-3-methyl-5-hydroxy-6-metoxy-1,4-benzoquinol methylase
MTAYDAWRSNASCELRARISWLSYPQRTFADAITRRLKHLSNVREAKIVDIPCGYGEVALSLCRNLQCRVTAVDIAAKRIEWARAMSPEEDIQFVVDDLYDYLPKQHSLDVVLLINSLFCLPDPARAIKLLTDALKPGGLAFVVIPNTDSANFKAFSKENPTYNFFAFNSAEACALFASNDLAVNAITGLGRSVRYGRPILRRMRSLSHIYLHWENYIKTAFSIGEFGYFLFELQKPEVRPGVAREH